MGIKNRRKDKKEYTISVMKKNIKIALSLFLIVGFILPINSFAQEYSLDPALYDKDGFLINQPDFNPDTVEYPIVFDDTIAGTQIESQDVKQGELASCFDYYTFPSVDVVLNTNVNSYDPGNSIVIGGKIKNNNNYPIVGVDVKARLVKNIPEPDYSRSEIMILDEFDVAENISVDTKGEYAVSYTYVLPKNSSAGQYQILFHVVEQDRYNLAGLNFTNDVVASKILFDVRGNNPEYVYLDQTQIMVGEQPHNVMAFVTQHKSNILIPITIPLYNPGSEDKIMSVTYDLYSWDSANKKNKIDIKTEEVTVPAQSEYVLTYEVDNGTLPVYYLSISAHPKGNIEEKTISNIRFALREETKSRINFSGVNLYPLKRGQESVLVTCFHDGSGRANLDNTRIETILYDQNNKEISRIEYDGKTIPDIKGIINKFTPTEDIVNFTVVTNMFDSQGNQIDSIEKKYNCQDINPTLCPVSKPLNPFVVIALIGIILGLIILVYKRKTINLLRV